MSTTACIVGARWTLSLLPLLLLLLSLLGSFSLLGMAAEEPLRVEPQTLPRPLGAQPAEGRATTPRPQAAVPELFGVWERAPSLPDPEGFAGMFAGVSHDRLLVAGGANFPEKKPWDGGQKVWTDAVFVLEREPRSGSAGDPFQRGEGTEPQRPVLTAQRAKTAWRLAGRLPRPLGYGVSVSDGAGVICVGGSDAERHDRAVFRLSWSTGRLTTTELPALPEPLANHCGALVGRRLVIAGGQSEPTASATSRRLWWLDLETLEQGWQRGPDLPASGRMLATAAADSERFFVIGGVDLERQPDGLVRRRYLAETWEFSFSTGWTQRARLPQPLAAAPSPAPVQAGQIFVLGGDDGTQVGVPPDQHRGFRRAILRYDVTGQQWSEVGMAALGRVTVPTVAWGDSWWVCSGEQRPGIRSPEVWRWRLE